VPPGAWDAWYHGVWPMCTQLFIYVNRVTGLARGLYVFIRLARSRQYNVGYEECAQQLKENNSHESWEWKVVEGMAGLYFLCSYESVPEEPMKMAYNSSCSQKIAKDGAFVVAMVAPLIDVIQRTNNFVYRCIHWECGFIGQMLYVEAVACGLSATGMGCFLDDLALQHFRLLSDNSTVPRDRTQYYNFYHFVIGNGTGSTESDDFGSPENLFDVLKQSY